MAEIEKSNLNWFNALPLEQQEIFNKYYPTDEEKIAWNNMGQPFQYNGPYDYPMEIDPMTGIGPGNATEIDNGKECPLQRIQTRS